MSMSYWARDARRFARKGRCAGMIAVTNNPLMKDEPDITIEFVEGTFRDVLVRVRDMVYEGHELITHPLFASLGMMWSPFRTVIVGERRARSTEFELNTVEEAIASYDQVTQGRLRQPQHDDDYAWMDRDLYRSALEEVAMIRKVSQ